MRPRPQMLEGSRGLLFTDEAPDVVSEWFASFQKADFARTGNKATETFSLPLGPVLINDEPAAHSLEPQLRKLGLSTSLLRGVPTLTAPHTVCTEGDTLNPNQVNLLKLFGKTYATVRPSLPRSLHARPSPTDSPYRRRHRPQFQIVPLLGLNLADGSICGGTDEAAAAVAADDE